jgi:hypothetical protein
MSEIERSNTRTLNGELAWRALDTARAKGKLDMGSWFQVESSRGYGIEVTPEQLLDENMCGTTACHAGWVVALSGYIMRDEPGGVMAIPPDGGAYDSVMSTARVLLGVSDDEALALFLDSGDDTIEETVTEIFGPRPNSSEQHDVPDYAA